MSRLNHKQSAPHSTLSNERGILSSILLASLGALSVGYAIAGPLETDLEFQMSTTDNLPTADSEFGDPIACREGTDRSDPDFPDQCAALAIRAGRWVAGRAAEAAVGEVAVRVGEMALEAAKDAIRDAQDRAAAGREQLADAEGRAGNHIATVPIEGNVEEQQFDYN